jgi:hypothetical protein
MGRFGMMMPLTATLHSAAGILDMIISNPSRLDRFF